MTYDDLPHYKLDDTGELLQYRSPGIFLRKDNWRNSRKSVDGRIALIDRDGVIINKPLSHQYHANTDSFALIEGAAQAIKYLNDMNIPAVLVTNQPGIFKGILDEEELYRMDLEIQRRIGQSAPSAMINAVIYCPHSHPVAKTGDDGVERSFGCSCRKPEPGMINAILQLFGVEPSRAYMFGDFESDISAAVKAHVHPVYIATQHDEYENTSKKIKAQYPLVYQARKDTLFQAVKTTL